MVSANLSTPRFSSLLKDHPDAIAALTCAVLVILGWQSLNLGWLGAAIFILTAAYVIGGFESAREGLTTLFKKNELDVDLLMIVAALGAAS
ncbi:MAG TPA: heavy metal translocating P-type ATPase, partial [Trichocoleus sp.]